MSVSNEPTHAENALLETSNTMTTASALNKHQNNFNIIRMVAASLVLVSHSFSLSGLAEPLRDSLGVTWGSIAVDVFFVTSGYLVTASILRGGNVRNFLLSRFLRIFPGLLVAVFLTTLVCSIWFTTLSFTAFWSQWPSWRYLIKNSLLMLPQGLEWTLPGTLTGIPGDKGGGAALNGSLWTLPVEVKMYLYLVIGYSICRLVAQRVNRDSWATYRVSKYVAFTLSALLLGIDLYFTSQGNHVLVFHMATMFFAGCALNAMDVKFKKQWPLATAMLIAVLLAAQAGSEWFMPIYILTLPWIVLSMAYAPTPLLYGYNRLGDYSYGVYIYAFPVQQWSAYLIKGIGPWEMTVVSLPIVLILAMLSWNLVEKRALAFKPKH